MRPACVVTAVRNSENAAPTTHTTTIAAITNVRAVDARREARAGGATGSPGHDVAGEHGVGSDVAGRRAREQRVVGRAVTRLRAAPRGSIEGRGPGRADRRWRRSRALSVAAGVLGQRRAGADAVAGDGRAARRHSVQAPRHDVAAARASFHQDPSGVHRVKRIGILAHARLE